MQIAAPTTRIVTPQWVGAILRYVCFAVAVFSVPSVTSAAYESTALIDYLRTQTATADRLVSLARTVCPQETFGEIGALVELTAANVAWANLTAESTRGAMNEALALKLDGESGRSLEVICKAVRQRAEAAGVLDLRTFSVLNTLAVLLRQSGRVAEARALLEEMLPIVRHYPARAAAKARTIMNTLAAALVMQGHLNEAERLFRECIASMERLDQVDPRQMGVDVSNLARVLDLQGRLPQGHES